MQINNVSKATSDTPPIFPYSLGECFVCVLFFMFVFTVSPLTRYVGREHSQSLVHLMHLRRCWMLDTMADGNNLVRIRVARPSQGSDVDISCFRRFFYCRESFACGNHKCGNVYIWNVTGTQVPFMRKECFYVLYFTRNSSYNSFQRLDSTRSVLYTCGTATFCFA